MRVVATQVGQYNQFIREPGEVFDLLNYTDGTYPTKTKEVPKKDKEGKVIPGAFETIVVKDKKTGKPIHRDFALDQGNRIIKSGPLKGEVVQLGWMKAVPDSIPIGLYPVGTDFWTPNVQLPQPFVRPIGQQDRRATQILSSLPKDEQPEFDELEDV
jgi:hypothetical protein